jgi:4-amino-4-deoxychorismate lyase
VILVDGAPAETIPATDRGLNYGDGLFETMRVHEGHVSLLEDHLARLRSGCHRLCMPYPGDAAVAADIEALVGTSSGSAIIKLVLTRGDGGRGYAPSTDATGRRIVSLHPLPDPGPASLVVGICRTRLGRSAALAGLKHLGRLEQVLAAGEAANAGWDEGLMLDEDALVIEATRHNVFYVRGGKVLTPPLAGYGVAGVMRRRILAALDACAMPGGEEPLHYHELDEVEELFLCNAVAGVRPVSRLDERELETGRVAGLLRAPLAEAGVAWLA